jgi:hypothetical protein
MRCLSKKGGLAMLAAKAAWRPILLVIATPRLDFCVARTGKEQFYTAKKKSLD